MLSGGLQRIRFASERSPPTAPTGFMSQDHRCSHHVETNADGWGDDVRLSDIEDKFAYTVCGRRGADIRPNFPDAKMGTG